MEGRELVLLGLNFVVFSVYHYRRVFGIDDKFYDLNEEMVRRMMQVLGGVFMDTGIFTLYLLAVMEKMFIPKEWIYELIQVLFVLSSVVNIKFGERRKYIFMQILNVIIISYYTIGTDPFYAFLVRYINNFFNIIVLKCLIHQIKKMQKDEVML